MAEGFAAAAAAESEAENMRRIEDLLDKKSEAAPASQPEAECAECVVCKSATRLYTMRPCLHMCACEPCALRLVRQGPRLCPECGRPFDGFDLGSN
jgi:pyrimidine deaminase RibD-like protein